MVGDLVTVKVDQMVFDYNIMLNCHKSLHIIIKNTSPNEKNILGLLTINNIHTI